MHAVTAPLTMEFAWRDYVPKLLSPLPLFLATVDYNTKRGDDTGTNFVKNVLTLS